jgi:iron complex outermembrane recepter protein
VPDSFEVATFTVLGTPQFQLTRTGQRSRTPLYAQGNFEILPNLKLTAGARYTMDSFEFVQRSGLAAGGQGTACGAVPLETCAAASEASTPSRSHAITWTTGLEYQATPGTLLYVTSRRGYKGAGFNANQPGYSPDPPQFGPEFVTDLELGIKSDWRLGSIPIRTNADVWGQDYSDIQVQVSDATYGFITENVAKAKLWGAELEALAQLTEDFQVGVSYSHQHINYESFSAEVQAATIASLEAQKTYNRPPNKYSIKAQYHLPLPSDIGKISARALWTWQAASGDTSVLNNLGIVPSFGLLNLSADWKGIYGSPVDVSLFGSNVLNKLYLTQAVINYEPGLGWGNVFVGEPRMYGIRVNYRFGSQK